MFGTSTDRTVPRYGPYRIPYKLVREDSVQHGEWYGAGTARSIPAPIFCSDRLFKLHSCRKLCSWLTLSLIALNSSFPSPSVCIFSWMFSSHQYKNVTREYTESLESENTNKHAGAAVMGCGNSGLWFVPGVDKGI